METADDTPLFSLSIDGSARAHLADAAKWARFIAIVGMVFLALAVVGILVFVYFLEAAEGAFSPGVSGGNAFAGFGLGIVVFYLLLLGIWFFPLSFLLRFANHTRTALQGDDQQALIAAAQNLKVCFRYIGIVTIVVLGLYGVLILLGIVGAAFMNS